MGTTSTTGTDRRISSPSNPVGYVAVLAALVTGVIHLVATILALFAFEGWSLEAFYRGGSPNPILVVTKGTEAVLAVCAVYLYVDAER